MSGKGNYYELAFSRHLHVVQSSHNAVMERFFLSLKLERIWQTNYANHQEAIRDISHYIVAFYNACRLHSTLGYCRPISLKQI